MWPGPLEESKTGGWFHHNPKREAGFDWMVAHEYGHLLGFRDEKTDIGPNPSWENNIMGVSGGRVEQLNIDRFMYLKRPTQTTSEGGEDE